MAGNSQNMQKKRVAYPNQCFDSALSPAANQQLLVSSVCMVNGSAASNKMGIAHSVVDLHWQVWQVNAGVTDLTAAVQAGTASDLIPTTNNYGFIVQAKNPFDLLALEISQASTGSPVYVYEYWNGSAWVALSLLNAPAFNAANKQAIAFQIPGDWATGDGGYAINDEFYSMRLTATTAPSQAVKVTGLKVCEMFAYREEVLPKAALQAQFLGRQFLLQQSESIVAFFAFPDSSNMLEMTYQINP